MPTLLLLVVIVVPAVPITNLVAVITPTLMFGVPLRLNAVDAIPVTFPVRFPIIPPENVETPVEFTFPVTFPDTFPTNPPIEVVTPET